VNGELSRRDAITVLAGLSAGCPLAGAWLLGGSAEARSGVAERPSSRAAELPRSGVAGRLKQSVSRWCYGRIPLDDLCQAAKSIGYSSVELLSEPDWATPKKHGLQCAMANGFGSIPVGFNRPDNHDKLVADAERMIPLVAAAGIPNIVVFSGNRAGLSDGDGITNCISGLRRVAPTAEKHGVTLCLEMLNSKVDHKDYQADHTAWAVEVVKGVGSPRLKLLYDIYHMQIDEGDVIATIRKYKNHIGHYHTAGVPGRNEIDESQELYYPAIMRAIADTGFKGIVAQEFIPKRDAYASLAESIKICDV